MKKIAVIGICGQSVFMNCDKLPTKGETIAVKSMHVEPGGKGTNVAVTIARLGGDVSFLVSLGDDEYGKKCKAFFLDENLNATCIVKHGKTDYAGIMCDDSGDNFVSVYMDENVRLSVEDLLSFESELESSDYVVCSAELPDDILLKIAELCEDGNKRIVFDPSPAREFPKEFLQMVWLFTPNETELGNLLRLCRPDNYVLTLGENGARLVENGRVTDFPAEKVVVNNTTGAGDVFNGALCCYIALGKSLADAVRFAVKASAFKVSKNYVMEGIPTMKDLDEMDEIHSKIKVPVGDKMAPIANGI